MRRKKLKNDYDEADLRRYMKVSAKQKLEYLEEMNAFLVKAMSPRSKQIWNILRRKGW